MIKIEERRCEKLSGLTSLFISFEYNQDIINNIKSNIDTYLYNSKTKEWEIPITYLQFILDNFTSLDDIELNIYTEPNVKTAEIELDVNKYKLKPYEHQIDAIKYGLTHNNWLLLDEMGLGKTKSIIHIAEELKERENIQHCLIICGINTLKANWKKEIKLHSDLSFRVIGEKISKKGKISYTSIKERCEELLNPIDEFFIITNIETLRSDEFINAFNKSANNIDMIVVDEIHKCSNKNSLQGNNLLKIKSKYKIAATGTILTNSPVNAFLPLKWIGVDKSNLTNFKRQYCYFDSEFTGRITGYKNLDILKEELNQNSLRRTKDILSTKLPPKTIIKEFITLSDEHRKFYDNVKNGVKEECNKIVLNTTNLLALVTRLRQATSCPQILTTAKITSSKLDRATDIIKELIDNNEKVVVFSVFKEPITELGNILQEYNPLMCTGDSDAKYIEEAVDKFQTDPKYKLLLGTQQKMGTGITLTAASYMIFIDTPFTAASFNQACDRIYRIGTERPVFIYNLICEDTIDERVAQIIDKKQAISDYMIDDKIDNSTFNILKDIIEDL